MKIECKGSQILIEIPPKETSERTAILSALSGVMFAGWSGADTIIYDTTLFSLGATASHLRMIELVAKGRGYDVSAEALGLMAKIKRKYAEEQEVERMIEQQRESRKTAISRLKNGCEFCGLLTWNGVRYVCGGNDKPCATDPEEVERNFEEWKLTRVFKRLTPFPNNDCQYLEVLR
ncbi:MAG: hypothetical protein IJV85_01305 [Clostridia bacterium]|nr:hypothetical protein [Clostridia bacterium]